MIGNHVSPVEVSPNREPDEQYKELLHRIRTKGRRAISGMDEGSVEVLGHQMVFNFEDGGFPVITERDLTRGTTPEIIANFQPNPEHRAIKGALYQGFAEVIAFMNGARTQEELERYGCKFWKPWTSDAAKAAKRGLELGDLGHGSYGAAFHDFPNPEDPSQPFDQYKALIAQINNRPELRTHIITPFIPPYLFRAPGYEQKVLIVPCHGIQHFNIDVENREMSLVHWQRSADVPIGLPFNMANYAAMLMMVAQVTGYKPKELVYQVSNAHMYNQHTEIVDELLSRPAFKSPILKLDPTVQRLEDFRVEHFSIDEYEAHPPIDMGGTAV
ncbi:TPA: thymidylate synthase [Candidatus Saccharibacteria bacterium]|nr:thymidylate synthase [Candidatus Saccharibacteria bacterium]HRK40850.1 thymidylate synthase [Candidatus Saccharibacteria bacterium]